MLISLSLTPHRDMPRARNAFLVAAVFCAVSVVCPCIARSDTFDEVRHRGLLIWGADSEGGGPYIYPDPQHPREMIGFEVELAGLLARELGVSAQFRQGPWDNLPALLGTGEIDILLNGYELTPARASLMEHTIPYYIYEFALLVRRDEQRIAGWDDFTRGSEQKRLRVGVLTSTAAHKYAQEHFGPHVEVIGYEGNLDAMRDVETGKLDATVADLPVVIFSGDRFAGLKQAGPPAGHGNYVIYLRKGDSRLRDALNDAIARAIGSGELRRIYEKYRLWSPAQEELARLARPEAMSDFQATNLRGWQVIAQRGPLLLRSAGMTVLLACASMPLAIAVGLLVALGRLYGPTPLRWLLAGYVEVLRGTPLLLQLYVIFYILPEIGLGLPAVAAAIAGLAINYSAYEAEIYRAGLLAVPRGQMEAALALGMSHTMALRRVVVPQAMRMVVPPVTNDFIALFKDTSVCSVITVVELTKQYSIQRNDTGATLELAALTAILYLLMSLPLAHLTKRLERKSPRT
jgi:polar amino acid transport system substrate-binding protein